MKKRPRFTLDARRLAMFRRRCLPACLLVASALLADTGRGQPPAKDLHGDPWPAGAVARLGTLRWLHEGTCLSAAFLPDGKSVVTTCTDRTIRVWEYPSGKERRRMTLPANPDWIPGFYLPAG